MIGFPYVRRTYRGFFIVLDSPSGAVVYVQEIEDKKERQQERDNKREIDIRNKDKIG
jgi:hypothetical protein